MPSSGLTGCVLFAQGLVILYVFVGAGEMGVGGRVVVNGAYSSERFVLNDSLREALFSVEKRASH